MGFIICLIGVVLPWKARVVYSELLGWIAQLVYSTYFFLFKVIIKNLPAAKEKDILK